MGLDEHYGRTISWLQPAAVTYVEQKSFWGGLSSKSNILCCWWALSYGLELMCLLICKTSQVT